MRHVARLYELFNMKNYMAIYTRAYTHIVCMYKIYYSYSFYLMTNNTIYVYTRTIGSLYNELVRPDKFIRYVGNSL